MVGACASDVWRIQAKDIDQVHGDLHTLVQQKGLMLQPFLQEVQQEGEYSFVFLGGTLSHTVLKRPQQNDFRVQPVYGGICQRVVPTPALLEQAKEVYQALHHSLLYARIDALVQANRLVVMEVELTEPDLLLRCDSLSPLRFAQVCSDRLRESKDTLHPLRSSHRVERI